MVIRRRSASQAIRYNRFLLVAASILFSLAGRTQPVRAGAPAASFPAAAQSTPAQPPAARTPAKSSPAVPRKQAPGTAAAAKRPPIKYFCYSTDAAQPAAYFSAIFDVPDAGGEADNFLRYEGVKIEFERYLIVKYKYPAPSRDNDNVDCEHLGAGSDKPDAVTARMTSEKQSGEAAVAAAKKPIVETGWKSTGTVSTSAALRKLATDSASQQGAGTDAKKQPPGGEKTADAASSSPAFVWHMETKKDALTDAVTSEPSATKFFLTDPAFSVTASAYCSSNGVSVFFLAAAGAKDTPPQYSWYQNPDDDSAQIADVRMRVDDRSVHVAHGFENVDGHTAYFNWLGLLFYEPGVVARAAQEQADSASTGIAALDGLVGGLVRQQAQANSQQWAESSAGPLSDLVNARSIRVELPLLNHGTPPVVDLNPQDKVLHEFVQTCNARFAGGRQ
ncbi:MAG: hypothetical protein ACRD40_02240 [Candidatus Acidiferrales bacterium]